MERKEIITFSLGESPYIELIKLLKAVAIVRSGAAAQEAVSNGEVLRNGELESRKRAKITAGERISFRQWEILVEL